MLRAVLDANVVVSGVLSPGGVCGRILALAARGTGFRPVTSPDILLEVRRSLLYDRVRRRHGLGPVEAFAESLAAVSDIVVPARVKRVVGEDPADDIYFAAALEGRATRLVSGDAHVLAVRVHGDVGVVRPREFLESLEGRGPMGPAGPPLYLR